MNTETQAVALWLADQLDKVPEHGADPDLIERSSAELRRLHTENQQLRADLEAIGAGGVGPLMHPAAQQASVGYRRAIMGFGKVAVGGCKAADNQMPGIIYLDMGGEQREPDTPCDDLFQPGTAADPSKILACVHFSTRASVWQTIDVLHEILDSEFGAATSPEGGS